MTDTTNTFTPRQQVIRDVLEKTELGHDSGYSIHNAEIGNSGYSVGIAQTDLGQLGENFTKGLKENMSAAIKATSNLADETVKEIIDALGKTGRSPVVDNNIKAIDIALDSKEGHAIVNGLDKEQIAKVERHFDTLRAAATPEAKAFLDTPIGFALTVDNNNQFGSPTRLGEFMSGKGATFFGGRPHVLEGPMTVEKFLSFTGDYKHSREYPFDPQRRLSAIAELYNEPGLKAAADFRAEEQERIGEEIRSIVEGAQDPRDFGSKVQGQIGGAVQDIIEGLLEEGVKITDIVARHAIRGAASRADGSVPADTFYDNFNAAMNAGMTREAATEYARNKASETAVAQVSAAEKAKKAEAERSKKIGKAVQSMLATLEGKSSPNKPLGQKPKEQKKNKPVKSWADVQKAKEKRIAKDEADADEDKKDGRKTAPHTYDEVGIRDFSLREDSAKKSTRHHTYDDLGGRTFSLREDRSKAGAARKSVSAPTAASRTTAREDDGGSDRDDPPSKPSAPQKTVDYEFEAIHRSSGGNDRDDQKDEPERTDPADVPWLHEGGVVSDNDPVIDEVAINVTAQEGEFVLSRAALAMLGEDLMGRVNRALRTGDSQTISRLRHVLHSRLGGQDAMPEADIKASMNERAYWDANDPGHTSAHARVAREFRVAFPGHSDMDKAEHIGGMITDHDPDTYLDDYKIDIPEGAFVVSRTATRLAGLPALMRLNALAEGSDAALAATLKRELEAALGIMRPAGEAELKAMMHDPRYTDAQHPEHIAYRQMIADGFRAAFPG